jgi:serine/tyrosine/threonine adenylyltransferase
MHALNVPTTRSLSLTYLPTLLVQRERMERAAIVTRVAQSFIRIGCFEALNPPREMFMFGGGQQARNLEALRVLGKFVAREVLQIPRAEGEPWGKELVMECARRNARMVAGWQAYGL